VTQTITVRPERKVRPRQVAQWALVVFVIGFCGLVLYLRETTYDSVIVLGDSMEPTLQDSDRLIALKHPYPAMSPQRGDIVVVEPGNGTIAVKRVVAVAGDRLYIARGHLYVNGRRCEESYVKEPMIAERPYGPLTVPEGHVYVMGDNRNHSEDSRDYGPVSYEHVTGLVICRIWPLSKLKYFRR